MSKYSASIDEMAKTEKYKSKVESLVCYHGIKNIFALTMITEIGDVKRLPSPVKLASGMGFDIREYSSGGRHNRLGITKHGNSYLRTAFVEANQRLPKNKVIAGRQKMRRKDVDTYSKVAFAKLYTTKTPITAADLLNDRVLPVIEEQVVYF